MFLQDAYIIRFPENITLESRFVDAKPGSLGVFRCSGVPFFCKYSTSSYYEVNHSPLLASGEGVGG